ncbi:MAG: hypothetical protein F6K28_25970 [Microcoleus sp. SIO2G3]|nr:hypothetical protein [Microcoleus sp. SIO2G3]
MPNVAANATLVQNCQLVGTRQRNLRMGAANTASLELSPMAAGWADVETTWPFESASAGDLPVALLAAVPGCDRCVAIGLIAGGWRRLAFGVDRRFGLPLLVISHSVTSHAACLRSSFPDNC